MNIQSLSHRPLMAKSQNLPNNTQPKFGIKEDPVNPLEKAEALYPAGVSLAKINRGDDAKALLLEAFEANQWDDFRIDIAKAFAEGVPPGLAPNPEKADELLQRVLKGSFYLGNTERDKIFNIYSEKLAPQGQQYADKALVMLTDDAKRMNLSGKLGVVSKMIKLGHADKAKALLSQSIEQTAGRLNDPRANGIFNDALRVAKIVGGIPSESGLIFNGKRQMEPEMPEVQDAALAKKLLEKLVRPESPRYILTEVLEILAFGKGNVAQDKALAKKLIDKLPDKAVVKEVWDKE